MAKNKATARKKAPKRSAKVHRSRFAPAPVELKQAIKDGRCAVFVGAGLSAGAGYPDWKKLLLSMIDFGVSHSYGHMSKSVVKQLRKLVEQPDKLLLVAEELRERFGRRDFEKHLEQKFGVAHKPTAVHERLVRIPFTLAVTTNYDRLIENAYKKVHKVSDVFSFTNQQPREVAEALWKNAFFVLKAHGDVWNPASLVLTERDYRRVVYGSEGYRSVLASIFATNRVFFVGVSLADPELRLLLAYLHDVLTGGLKHYALVSDVEFPAIVRERWRKDFSVECLPYKASRGHPEVLEFVKTLPRAR